MDRQEKETVIVERGDDRRSNGVWVSVIVAVIILILLFLMFGGYRMFSGGSPTVSTPTTNVSAPTSSGTSR